MLRSTPPWGPDVLGRQILTPSAGRTAVLRGLAVLLIGSALVSCGAAAQEAKKESEGKPDRGLPATAQLDLVSIDYDDEVREAAKDLAGFLEGELKQAVPVEIDVKRHDYEPAATVLVNRAGDPDYLAWLTPYVYVVAEMLGAEIEVIGTYRSRAVLGGLAKRESDLKADLKALEEMLEALEEDQQVLEEDQQVLEEDQQAPEEDQQVLEEDQQAPEADQQAPEADREDLEKRKQELKETIQALEAQRPQGGYTYRSYLVVNKKEMEERLGRDIEVPGLPAFEEYLRALEKSGKRPTFYFHNKFSTSSFFLPSVYFRDQGMIDLIRAEDIRKSLGMEGEPVSSKRLVEKVAASEGPVLAAVWDGTKTAFESGKPLTEYGSKVHFIALENELPNDLLVVSSSMGSNVRDAIRNAIARMPETTGEKSEVRLWRPIDDEATRKAHSALVGLRQLAHEQMSPVTVRIDEVEGRKDTSPAVLQTLRRAAEDAVRLSGTEFVLWSEFYAQNDFRWKLREMHDGAVELSSDIEHLDGLEQKFQISFENPTDLTERIGDLIRSRMHRLRYVWPYSKDRTPTILRDVDFSVAKGETIQVQKIRWLDRTRNEFSDLGTFPAEVETADTRKFELSPQRFDASFNPMDSVSYRAVLERPSEERLLFTTLTWVLILLFLGAGVTAAFELRPSKVSAAEATPGDRLGEEIRKRVDSCHEALREGARKIAKADLIGEDSKAIEVYVAKLKRKEGTRWRRILDGLRFAREDAKDRRDTRELLRQKDKIGDIDPTHRLAGLIEFLVRRDLLSDFIGTSLEFEAWNRAAGELLSRTVAAGDSPQQEAARFLDRESADIVRVVSTHFNRVLDGAREPCSLFTRTWSTRKDPEDPTLWIWSHEEKLEVGLDLGCLGLATKTKKPDLVHDLRIEFKLSPPVHLTLGGQDVKAWLLGTLDRQPKVVENDDGKRFLRLRFQPLAVFRAPAC